MTIQMFMPENRVLPLKPILPHSLLFILFLRGREHARGRGRGQGRERIWGRLHTQLRAWHGALSHDMIWGKIKSRALNWLTQPGTPLLFILIPKHILRLSTGSTCVLIVAQPTTILAWTPATASWLLSLLSPSLLLIHYPYSNQREHFKPWNPASSKPWSGFQLHSKNIPNSFAWPKRLSFKFISCHCPWPPLPTHLLHSWKPHFLSSSAISQFFQWTHTLDSHAISSRKLFPSLCLVNSFSVCGSTLPKWNIL